MALSPARDHRALKFLFELAVFPCRAELMNVGRKIVVHVHPNVVAHATRVHVDHAGRPGTTLNLVPARELSAHGTIAEFPEAPVEATIISRSLAWATVCTGAVCHEIPSVAESLTRPI